MNRILLRQAALCLALCLAWGLTACALPRITMHQDPLSPAEHLKLGLAYESSGDLPGALHEYELAMDQEPLAHLYAGNVLFGMGKMEEAEKAYNQAMLDLPLDPEPRNNLAWLLYSRRQRLDQAEGLAAEALRLAPPDRQAEFRDTLECIQRARAPKSP
ncbi:MAG: tetratricopeptide repeat protein [Proteobacteria bacterium]|nr:tetratricopeptide repeat protein [Pseudomonadota bacterium]